MISPDHAILSCIPAFTSYFSPSFTNPPKNEFSPIVLSDNESIVDYLIIGIKSSSHFTLIDLMPYYSNITSIKTSLLSLSQQYHLNEEELFHLCEWCILNELLLKYNAVPDYISIDSMVDYIEEESNEDLILLYKSLILLYQLKAETSFAILPCLTDDNVMKEVLERSLASRNDTQHRLALEIIRLRHKTLQFRYYYQFYFTQVLHGMFIECYFIL